MEDQEKTAAEETQLLAETRAESTGVFLDAEDLRVFKEILDSDEAIAQTINQLIEQRAKLTRRSRREWKRVMEKHPELQDPHSRGGLVIDFVTGEFKKVDSEFLMNATRIPKEII